MNGESLNILQDRLEKLKTDFPEIFTEGKIDIEKFKATFTDDINFNNERYVLNWAGKSDAFKVLQIPTTATLKPQPGESVNFDTTENIFIEGENLEVLKVLQKSYYGKIKCIIIDPPYNTGNDSFIYPDSFKENKADYEKRIGDKDEEGYLMKEGMFRKNSKDSGHYHSNWLSMMYPRLFLAKNLLREDGVIFVHIDDNEVHNLRMIMNEIFGEENFVVCFPRITKKAGKTTDKIAKNNDYILCFSRTESAVFNPYEVVDEAYKNKDEYFEERGYYKLSQTLDYGSIQYSPSLDYEIEINDTIFRPGGVSKEEMEDRKRRNPSSDYCWRWSKELFEFGLKNGFIVVKKTRNGARIYTKTYQNASISKNTLGYFIENKERKKSATTLEFIQNKFSNDNSRKDFNEIFETNVFEYSKPVQLLKELISLIANPNDIIIDFFAGSGTTAQAVLELNKEDSGNRKFILVQLPELCDENSEAYKAGYKTIADIGKERIRKVIQKMNNEIEVVQRELNTIDELIIKNELELSEMKKNRPELFKNQEPSTEIKKITDEIDRLIQKQQRKDDQLEKLIDCDKGFKSFKLSPSNFKIWRGSEINEKNLVQQLDAFINPVREGSEQENMLYELMLKAGYSLTDKVEKKENFYSIKDNELIIVIESINQARVDKMIALQPKKIIALDNLFTGNDQLKTNTVLQMKDAGVNFKTI